MSEIITFYSYKGGVGRTMALANIAAVLSKWGHKVLVVDWDFEAPGLEHFYKNYIDVNIVKTKLGVIDLLQMDTKVDWLDAIIQVNIPQSDTPIHFISSGKRDENYFKKVRTFNVDIFYDQNGGEIIEKLRNDWLANYDYILIDSRTGITEIGGICTIQIPNIVVMLFTATNQGFDGVLDIIKRAGNAQQKLPYDRQKLIFLPIPSKFETNTEFKLSKEWLQIFAKELKKTYEDWLPTNVDCISFLQLTKIPYVSYFSFGEKLPVIEQGVKDPSGLGYAYETLAAILGNNFDNVDWLFNNRDQYISRIKKESYLYDIVISCSHEDISIALQIIEEMKRVGISYYLYTEHTADNWGKNLFEITLEKYSSARYTLLLISKHSINNRWSEIERLITAPVNKKIEVLPLLIDDVYTDSMGSSMASVKWNNDPREIVDILSKKILPQKITTSTDLFTRREIEIIKLLINEYNTREIANLLNLSIYTVETHRKNISRKTNTMNTNGLIKFISENNVAI